MDHERSRQTDKPVGFYGPIAPLVSNAPSLRICGQNPRNDADATFLDPHISVVECCCTPAGTLPVLRLHATIADDRREVAGMANFKMYLLRQFCWNRVKFFCITQETQTQK